MFKRDQKKGFDRLEPEGFYDAVRAYGLPEALIAFDRSAQENVPYRIKTFFGLTNAVLFSSITKQGGPLSPLKCTLTSSMCNHWLRDEDRRENGLLSIRTVLANGGGYHTPANRITLEVGMVEAMDDSGIATTTSPIFPIASKFHMVGKPIGKSLRSTSGIYQTLPTPSPYSLQTHSTTAGGFQCPSRCIMGIIEFLRVHVNDPHAQFDKLSLIIDGFEFPVLRRNLPLTLIRRIITSSLVSRIKPHLATQPLTIADAKKLDQLISNKVHSYLGWPFHFNTTLLSLPIPHLGFDFPSISRLNQSLAVKGLIRDLNHHVAMFRDMAQISLADWMCNLNNCSYPIEGKSLSRSFIRHKKTLPFAFALAQSTLNSVNTSLRPTDISFFLEGDVSVQHIYKSLPYHLKSAIPLQIHSFLKPIRLNQIARWTPLTCRQIPRLTLITSSTITHPSSRLHPHLANLKSWLEGFNLKSLTHTCFGLPSNAFDAPYSGFWHLAIPPNSRQLLAESILFSISSSSAHPPLPSADFPNISASDGSTSSKPLPLHRPLSAFSSISTSRSLLASLDAFANSANNQLAEIYGILSAILHLPTTPQSVHFTIFSDNANAVRHVNNILSSPSDPPKWITNPARALYRWIAAIVHHRNLHSRVSVIYTPSHTSSNTIPARANDLADRLASSHIKLLIRPPPAPLPTFFMDNFTLFSDHHSYIEADPLLYISTLLASKASSDLDFRPASTLLLPLHDPTPPPTYPYTRSSADFSIVLQLYARSSQLDTTYLRAQRHLSSETSSLCSYGCAELETPHHLFATCPYTGPFRAHATSCLLSKITSLSQRQLYNLSETQRTAIANISALLFEDSDIWPLQKTRYYLGVMPDMDDLVPSISSNHRARRAIVQAWHTASIYLAGRIWGDYRRRIRPSQSTASSRNRTITLPQFLSHLQ
ncbi:hypothetical protein V5O48_010397 [Marasmius crinis-equi]|uniref:RNase H type-1 domain-containing protein n=1 Tax=Marasmius crinis-equi TaxID=585013 RepID=A0ABR3F8J6_9AGAR